MNKQVTIAVIFLFGLVLDIFGQVVPDISFNTLFRTENGGWVAGDATFSVALPDGRTIWLFGDSFIGTVNPDSSLAPGANMIRNCAVIQEGDNLTAMYQGTFENPLDFVETDTPDSTWFWPEHGLVENNTLKIIFSEFGTGDGQPGWNFEYRNACIVLFTYPEIELIGYNPLPYYEQNGVMYGDRLITHGDYTYIFGRKEENHDWHIPYVHLARAEVGNLHGDWEFYSGSVWSTDPEASVRLTDNPVSQQYGVFMHEEKFVMITQEIWLGTKIYSLTADQPEGPWENITELYNTPFPFLDMFTYNAYPHSQFDENNALLVSYNSNSSFWEIFNNVELYRPKFIRVPYIMIDSTFIPSNIIQDIDNGFSGINCYPNPASEKISFSFILEKSDYVQLRIYNLAGIEVIASQSRWFPPGKNNIESILSDLPYGIYIYQIQNSRGWFIHN